MSHFIPVLTTPAGLTLTALEWTQAGVKIASFYLESLLLKPGYESLKTIPSLSAYLGWSQRLVLNASTLNHVNPAGEYRLRSSYDGSVAYYSPEKIIALLLHLQPSHCVIPASLWNGNQMAWTTKIYPFLLADELGSYKHLPLEYGIYYVHEGEKNIKDLIALRKRYQNHPCYIKTNQNMASLSLDNVWIESNLPAEDGFNGRVYTAEGVISLEDAGYAHQFAVIEKNCHCATCSSGLTRAYLHHLWFNTPLLCQRYLIQHNVYYANSLLVHLP